MKVFLCKGSFFGPASGADQMILAYATHLRRAGHRPTVIITVAFARSDRYYRQLRAVGIPVKCLGRHPLYLFLLGLRRIANAVPWLGILDPLRDWERNLFRAAVYFLKRHRPDVLHVIAEGGLFIQAAHGAGRPVLYQEPAIPRYSDRPEIAVSYDKLAQALPLSSELAAVSPTIARLCRERMPCPARVSVLPILIDDLAHGVLKEHGATDEPTFGFAARLERLKGPDVLIDAFALLLRRFPGARLLLAGSGEDEEQLRARVESLGITASCELVGAYGSREQMADFMRRLDVLVHPSLAEGTPCTIIEAMSFGLPIVATSVGGVPDMVLPEAGVLVPPGDPEPLAEAMERLAVDWRLRMKMGAAARAVYEQTFSPEAVLPLLERTYRRLAPGEAPSAREAVPGHRWEGFDC